MANNRTDWIAPYDFIAAQPTFVNVWSKAWNELSPDYEIVPLNSIECNALGLQIMGFRHWFTPASVQPLVDLAYRLDAVITRQNRSSFIRLSSRSPKDSLYAMRKGMCIHNGGQALAVIIEGSERCAADLRMALDNGYQMAIIVRKWIDFPVWAEYRCFMVNRCWVGASQAKHLEEIVFPLIPEHLSDILCALNETMKKIIAASPIDNAAFDLVFYPLQKSNCAILLDVNPLFTVTDTALFSSVNDFDFTFRFRHFRDKSIYKILLPSQNENL
jgi:hypothetical protein